MKAIKTESTGRWSLEGVEPSEATYLRILQKLEHKEPFSFARFGDGELNAMMGKAGHNCDKHEYFPDMGKRLKQIFLSKPEYMVGIQPLSVSQEKYLPLIEQAEINFVNADVIHNASIDERLGRFFDVLKTRKVVLVGPQHLEFFKATLLVIPDRNCWLEYERIKDIIQFVMIDFEKIGETNVVFLLCASMMSEVIIDTFKNSGHTFIDMGSSLDFYAGKPSRSYHYKMQ